MTCPAVVRVTVPGGPAVVQVVTPGPPGPQGEPGPPNTGFVFTQSTPASTWTINHNLGFKPAVEVFNTGSQEIEAAVTNTTINQTVISLNVAVAGFVRLN